MKFQALEHYHAVLSFIHEAQQLQPLCWDQGRYPVLSALFKPVEALKDFVTVFFGNTDVLIERHAQWPCFAGLCEKMKMQETIKRNNAADAE